MSAYEALISSDEERRACTTASKSDLAQNMGDASVPSCRVTMPMTEAANAPGEGQRRASFGQHVPLEKLIALQQPGRGDRQHGPATRPEAGGLLVVGVKGTLLA